MGQFPDVKWPAEYAELTRIDELLHCRICYEYIETSVITPCSHNYCSLCIRKFLHYKTQCPVCFETIYEKDLHANRILDEILESYLSLSEKLFACIEGVEVKRDAEKEAKFTLRESKTPQNKTANRSFLQITPNKKLFGDNSADPSPVKFTSNESQLVETPRNKSSSNFNSLTPRESRILNTPSKSKNIPGSSNGLNTPKMNSIFSVKNEKRITRLETKGKRVPCPVCSIDISEGNINRHLDDCLKRQKGMSPQKTKKNDLEPMPKYVINLMKDSELRKLLKKYGLSTSGTRKAIEKRLQKFSALYNAERDKISPKSVADLVKLCEGEENAERNILKQNSSDNMPSVDGKADLSLIEKSHKEYIHRNKGNYQKLIEAINSREKERNKPNRSLFGLNNREECVSVASTSSASQKTNSQSILNRSDEANETNLSTADNSHWFQPDSDSTDTSYPLQHYSNEDPMRFLALEISTDSQEEAKSKFEKSSSSINDMSSISSKVKTESFERSMSSSDLFNSPNGESSSPIVRDSKFLGGVEMNASNYDIFEASTEDNWSDSTSREFDKCKSKKFTLKRLKVEKEDSRSTDSETDVETSLKYTGRKTTKKIRNKKGVKVKVEENNGNVNGEKIKPALDIEFEGEVVSAGPSEKHDKENSEGNDSRDLTIARMSLRKRNHVSYAVSNKEKKKKNKPLDEIPVNIAAEKNEEKINVESTDLPENATIRSLRKRRKRL